MVTPDPGASLLTAAIGQWRAGVHPLRVARFLLWHAVLAPLAAACGIASQVKLDWLRRLGADVAAIPVGDCHLLLALRGTGTRLA